MSSGVSLARKGPLDVFYYTHPQRGYEMVKNEDDIFQAHRLQAVAYYGFEAVEDNVVHHRTEIPWLNTEPNLEVMSKNDHLVYHKTKMDWLKSLKAAEMYREGASSRDIAPTFDVSQKTILSAVRKVDPELVRNNGGVCA